MKNNQEARRWLQDAIDFLKSAEHDLAGGFWRSATQNAQLCIEHSAKAIISLFEEPEWTHDPSRQLLRILAEGRMGEKTRDKLKILSEDARIASPWHGISTYGKISGGIRLPASEICTREIAEEMLSRAKTSLGIAEEFIEAWG